MDVSVLCNLSVWMVLVKVVGFFVQGWVIVVVGIAGKVILMYLFE